MAKTKDFFGKDITEVIEQACKFYETTQDQLDIEILETGSAGIFGLCRKQAHIRASQKEGTTVVEKSPVAPTLKKRDDSEQEVSEIEGSAVADDSDIAETEANGGKETPETEDRQRRSAEKETEGYAPKKQSGTVKKQKDPVEDQQEKAEVVEPPSQQSLDEITHAVNELLALMEFPSQVTVTTENCTVHCNIASEYEEGIIGPEGRTLDSLQYLLRKMLLQNLPDRFMLSLDVGNFRERRAEELKERAVLLAAQVKEDGKTQAIPALNPSERRIVHMILQEDKGIRSRSVGDGLFKKVLIYKPGKGRRSGPKRRKG